MNQSNNPIITLAVTVRTFIVLSASPFLVGAAPAKGDLLEVTGQVRPVEIDGSRYFTMNGYVQDAGTHKGIGRADPEEKVGNDAPQDQGAVTDKRGVCHGKAGNLYHTDGRSAE